MSAQHHGNPDQPASSTPTRVTTMISCPNVQPLARHDLSAPMGRTANENHWFDAVGFRRHWYANFMSLAVALVLLFGGVWIVTEFLRLQKVVACYEAGRRDCLPLDLERRLPPRT